MTEHERNGEIPVTTDEGVVGSVVEYKCGSKYILVDDYCDNYCPRCGEEL